MDGALSLCTFRLGAALFGVDIARVREVTRFQEVTPVPLAALAVAGLVNLRGEIITAVDLGRLLGHDQRLGPAPVNIVVRTDGGVVSLLVDSIGEVVDVRVEDLDPPPEALQGSARDLIRGSYTLPDDLLLALDVDRAAALAAAGRR